MGLTDKTLAKTPKISLSQAPYLLEEGSDCVSQTSAKETSIVWDPNVRI